LQKERTSYKYTIPMGPRGERKGPRAPEPNDYPMPVSGSLRYQVTDLFIFNFHKNLEWNTTPFKYLFK
jgi:hypothetical protein